MADNTLRVTGQVLDNKSSEPIEGAYIDIADRKDKLDFTLVTPIITDKEGKFDTRYVYEYEKWYWIGLPVFWLPQIPETIYIEAYKEGYRSKIMPVASRNFSLCDAACPANAVPPVFLRKD
jgi:hypothetical protein